VQWAEARRPHPAASLLPADITGGVIAPAPSPAQPLSAARDSTAINMAIEPGATTPQKQRERAEELALAQVALAVSVGLLLVKFSAYGITGSSAVFSDALESIVNVTAAILALVALRVAHSPADDSHPYGHGKAEFLSAATEGGMILLAGPVIVAQAMLGLLHHTVERPNIGAWLMIISLVANSAAGLALLRRARRGNSIALEADGKHLLADAVTSAAVLVALVLVWVTGLAWIDTATALLIAAYLAFLGINLMRRSMAGLMDRQDARDDAMIRRILDAHVGNSAGEPRICSYHKLRHRHSGRYHWVEFHLVVPADWNIAGGHRAAAQIEKEIESALGEGNATAHVEPCEAPDCPMCGQASSARRASAY
jgi:cation diffusion facilitator family transporter